jgi:transposase-like protein
MTKNDERRLAELQYAERTRQVAKTCRYLGIGRPNLYRWKRAYEQDGEAGLFNAKARPSRHRLK